ncbi:hypothetical protein IKF92_01040 [Candidatus Saccharibacteria bacterium]|nr:hypothetical protein [Candidatus Saccharibacteria bacterium]
MDPKKIDGGGNSNEDETTVDGGLGPDLEEAKNAIVGVTPEEEPSAIEVRQNKAVEVFEPAVNAVEKYFGQESAERVNNDLRRIDDIEEKTIKALENTDAMTDHAKGLVHDLRAIGIEAGNLTIAEAQSVDDFANNATPEVMDKKADIISEAISGSITSTHSRRHPFNPALVGEDYLKEINMLQDKCEAWDDRKVNTERGFDVENVYARLVEEGEIEPSDYAKQELEDSVIEDLIERYDLDERDFYVYGPFTGRDLNRAKDFLEQNYTQIVNRRFNGGMKRVNTHHKQGYKTDEEYAEVVAKDRATRPEIEHSGASLASLLNETIRNNSQDIEGDLVRNYVASEILQTRRLDMKNLVITSSAVSLEVLNQEKPSPDDKRTLEEYHLARQSVKMLAYYSGRALDYDQKEMKKRFGSTRPLSKEFFEEVASATEQLSDARSEYLDDEKKQYLVKMDEHLHEALIHLGALSAENRNALFSEDLD